MNNKITLNIICEKQKQEGEDFMNLKNDFKLSEMQPTLPEEGGNESQATERRARQSHEKKALKTNKYF